MLVNDEADERKVPAVQLPSRHSYEVIVPSVSAAEPVNCTDEPCVTVTADAGRMIDTVGILLVGAAATVTATLPLTLPPTPVHEIL